MKRVIFLGVVLAVLVVGMVQAQAPLEPNEGGTTQELVASALRFDDATASTFPLAGEGKMQRSGIMLAWKYTSVLFTVTGTAPNFKAYYYAGVVNKLSTGVDKADTTTMVFAVFDSSTVTAAGTYHRQISDYMPVAPYWYVKYVAQTGNGANTVISPVKAIRNRY